MLSKKHLDIKLHIRFVKSGKGSIQLKKQDFPISLGSIVPTSSSPSNQINNKMRLSTVESLLESAVNDADINGFDRSKFDYSLDKSQFFSGAYLYGIVDPTVDIDDSPTSLINKSWTPVTNESIWREMLEKAKEEYEPVATLGRTRNHTVNIPTFTQVLKKREMHLVTLVTTSLKKKSNSRGATKRSGPPLSSESIRAKAAKKAENDRFKLNFKHLQLEISAPIWKMKEKNSEITVRKTMSTEKFVVKNYNFEQYINRGSVVVQNNTSNYSSSSTSTTTETTPPSLVSAARLNVSQVDDTISSVFRLSNFRKDVMTLALNQEPDIFSGKISSYSKLYINQSYTQNAWKEVKSTDQLNKIILEEHGKKNRLTGEGSLKLKVSLGYNRNVNPIIDSLNEYFDVEGDFASFSQEPANAMSPELKKNSTERRHGFNDTNGNVESLLKRMFSDKDSTLHHGFLVEHRMSFARSLRKMVKAGSYCENSSLFDALKDSKKLLTNDEVQQYLLEPYFQEGNFESTNKLHPEKGKYPPRNRMVNCPQYFKDFKQYCKSRGIAIDDSSIRKNDHMSNFCSVLDRLVAIEEKGDRNDGLNDNNTNNDSCTMVSSVNISNSLSEEQEEIDFISFTCQWDKVPISIMVENEIGPNSTMQEVLLSKIGDDPCIDKEFGLNLDSNQKLYFRMSIKNGSSLIMRKSQFLSWTIAKILKIKNLATPVSIHILRDFE